VFAATQSRVSLNNVHISDTSVEFDGGALVVETNAVLKLTSTTITNATGELERFRSLHWLLAVTTVCIDYAPA
jgi:hypothetical protein